MASIGYDRRLTTDRDRVRFYIHDTVDNAGPLPGDANFTDNELTGLIATEGTWQRAVAAAYEALAAAWRKHPSFSADGMKLDRSNIADGFVAQAVQWRKLYGTATAPQRGRAGSRASTRVDGYSDDVNNFQT